MGKSKQGPEIWQKTLENPFFVSKVVTKPTGDGGSARVRGEAFSWGKMREPMA